MRLNLTSLIFNNRHLNGESEFNYVCGNSRSDPKQTRQDITLAFGILISYWWGWRFWRRGLLRSRSLGQGLSKLSLAYFVASGLLLSSLVHHDFESLPNGFRETPICLESKQYPTNFLFAPVWYHSQSNTEAITLDIWDL